MIELVLMRHGKAASHDGEDRDRPLESRGIADVRDVAARLLFRGFSPERVLASDARRVRETCDAIQTVIGSRPTAFFRALYLGGADRYALAIAAVPAGTSSVLVVGHNPDLEALTAALSGQLVALGTANAVRLRANAPTFAAFVAGQSELVEVVRPRA